MANLLEFLEKHWLLIFIILVIVATVAFAFGGWLFGSVASAVAVAGATTQINKAVKLEKEVIEVKSQAEKKKARIDAVTRQEIKKGHHMTNKQLVDDVMNDVGDILGGE